MRWNSPSPCELRTTLISDLTNAFSIVQISRRWTLAIWWGGGLALACLRQLQLSFTNHPPSLYNLRPNISIPLSNSSKMACKHLDASGKLVNPPLSFYNSTTSCLGSSSSLPLSNMTRTPTSYFTASFPFLGRFLHSALIHP